MTRAELLKVAKPILFNTEMVRAILEDRKTATRRCVKPQPSKDMIHKLGYCIDGDKKDIGKFGFGSNECGGKMLFVKPPCHPGDILCVRETWCWCPCWDCGFDTEEHKCIYAPSYKIFQDGKAEWGCYGYKASFEDNEYPSADTWHPSIHMPKEAARIFLKVKDVRVERLQDITENGIRKEGVVVRKEDCVSGFDYVTELYFLFQRLWDSTIQKADIDKYGWAANPWVWVYEFERIKPDAEV